MYITHLLLNLAQEMGSEEKLTWVKIIRPATNPSLFDPVQIFLPYLWNVNNSLDIIL